MAHEEALARAWESLASLGIGEGTVRFLGEEYAVDVAARSVASVPRVTAADDHLAVLILHYLARSTEGLPSPAGDWLSLSELSIGSGFADVYVERVVGPLRSAFGPDPERLYAVLESVPGERVARADAAVVLQVFDGVPMLVDVYAADDEFDAEAGVLFDRSVTQVFCTEDVVELAETAADAVVDRGDRAG